MEHLIRSLNRQLERIADTYEKDLAWRQQSVETWLSPQTKAALIASIARGAAIVRRLDALAASFKALDESTSTLKQ